MCDLSQHGAPRRLPKGVAFEIVDLILVKQWAEHHDFRMVIRLDHGATVDEEHEEAIALQIKTDPLQRLIIWRNSEAVFLQPLVGRRKRYTSVADALKSLLPKSCLILTDITATVWPG